MTKEIKTSVVYDERHQKHQTRRNDPVEIGARVDVVRNALLESNIDIIWKEPAVYEHRLIARTHSQGMLGALKKYSALADPGDQIFTKFWTDSAYSTPITRGTYDQALISACCSIEAAMMIKTSGAKLTLSLSRPPGHHAGYDFYHGFCFMNNGVLAARTLCEKAGKVAILDFDIHHCDGTQDILYKTGEALVISLHADPKIVFPNTGFAEEHGEGFGEGMIVNLPLEIGISAKAYKNRFDEAIHTLDKYRPDVVVVEAGFDGNKADFPPGLQPLTELDDGDYGYLGEGIGKLGVPSCVILEGGYNLTHLPNSFLAFFTALENRLVQGKNSL